MLTAVCAVAYRWSLPEFCWSTWLGGLAYSWTCVVTAAVQIVVTARRDKGWYEERVPYVRRVSPGVFVAAVSVVGAAVGLVAVRVYAFVFGFYGLFISVFAEMEPLDLFGRNGFINSDFVTPLGYLVEHFWPVAVGVLVANWRDLVRRQPWRRLAVPLQRQVVRIHVTVVALPFLSLLAWMVFGESYQPVTVVLLLAVLFLLPKGDHAKAATDNPGERSSR